MYYSYSACMYYSYRTCMYYSYRACMYYSHSTCIMSYRAHVSSPLRRGSGRRSPPGQQGCLGRRPPNERSPSEHYYSWEFSRTVRELSLFSKQHYYSIFFSTLPVGRWKHRTLHYCKTEPKEAELKKLQHTLRKHACYTSWKCLLCTLVTCKASILSLSWSTVLWECMAAFRQGPGNWGTKENHGKPQKISKKKQKQNVQIQ